MLKDVLGMTTWIIFLLHIILGFLSLLYLLSRYLTGCHVHRAIRKERSNSTTKSDNSKAKAPLESVIMIGAGVGCGREEGLRIVPYRHSKTAIFLQVLWVLLMIATIAVLYLANSLYNPDISIHRYSLASSICFGCLFIEVLLLGYAIACKGVYRKLTLIATSDPTTKPASHVHVEFLAPRGKHTI